MDEDAKVAQAHYLQFFGNSIERDNSLAIMNSVTSTSRDAFYEFMEYDVLGKMWKEASGTTMVIS
jgi:hypothetical protein